MRFLIITAALGLLAWSSPGLRTWVESRVERPVDPKAAAAIELRCGSEKEAFRDECARELKRDFELGVRQPDAILRVHCTRVSNDWAREPVSASPICQEIYGGWIRS
jgi:hypothetical protein